MLCFTNYHYTFNANLTLLKRYIYSKKKIIKYNCNKNQLKSRIHMFTSLFPSSLYIKIHTGHIDVAMVPLQFYILHSHLTLNYNTFHMPLIFAVIISLRIPNIPQI